MDPNSALIQIRVLLRIRRLSQEQSAELQDLVEELDEWLVSGGFLPAAWRSKNSSRSSRDVAEKKNNRAGTWPIIKKQ